jgi:hypothetical protein
MSGLEMLKESLKQAVLKQMRKHKMNQDKVAANTKFTPADICNIIGKNNNSTLETVDELAEGFNCTAKIVFVPKANKK